MQIGNGISYPFGTTLYKGGVNFSIYGKEIEKIELCIYNEVKGSKLCSSIDKIHLDPILNRTGEIWHVWVKGLPENFIYTYEIVLSGNKGNYHGILDPYAKNISSEPFWHDASRKKITYKPMGKFYLDTFDWENEVPLNIPKNNLIIYEMHVRGFTKDPSSQVQFPGTYRGMIEKIPYLVELGVNAVELMPIQEFCEEDVINVNPRTNKKLHNYFGYSTVNFFSPMVRYASESINDKAIVELKTLIKELHKNKIEVILDIVFNHTSEGNEKGPILSYKALDRGAYYMVNAEKEYLNFSGCGNTFNCNHPISRELIMSALRHWVVEYHVDGFRFDLAAIFHRGKDGTPLEYTSVMEELSSDPVLSSKKMIAEPWDAAGLYSLGRFAAYDLRWSEWNGQYQSIVRNFIKGTSNYKDRFAKAITGSHDIFQNSPYSSVNYISAHDGFSLGDLVSYNEKHNEENGENNADGINSNDSWNCGIEGETSNKKIINLRRRQMKNLLLALMISQGIPMVLMGDEYGHTRKGNNNPWGQDNRINWFLWDKAEQEGDLRRFFRGVIHFRRNSALLKFENFLTDNEIKWHGLTLNNPEWENDNKLIAFSLHLPSGEPGLYVAFNASHLNQTFRLPELTHGKQWRWVVNTHNLPPKDFFDEGSRSTLASNEVQIGPYSAIMLEA